MEIKSGDLIKALRADNSREFILLKLGLFCKRKDIAIKYITLYMYEENGLAE